jgi:hypothetical protein
VLARALAKDPDHRTGSAAAFADEVRTAVPAARSAATANTHPANFAIPLLTAALLGLLLVLTLPDRRPRDGELDTPSAPTRATLADLENLVRDGTWQHALALAEQVTAPAAAKRALMQTAFRNGSEAFAAATGAPTWLSFCDERRRARWFGDRTENAGEPIPAATTAAVPTGIDGLQAFALRLPLDSAEHWLAELGAAHLRGNGPDGNRAAEMAWLSGAGEFAVLLDAYLQVAPLPGTTRWRLLAPRDLERLRRRTAGGDVAEAPAGAVLLALLDVLHGLPLDPDPLRPLPASLRAHAGVWCLGTADADPAHRDALRRLAAALGAEVPRGG